MILNKKICKNCGQILGNTTHKCPKNQILHLGKYALLGNIPWNKGKKNIYSKETLLKMSDSAKRVGKGAKKGVPKSEEAKRNMRVPHESVRGEKSYNWKGGVSLDKRTYGVIRNAIRRSLKLKADGSYTSKEWKGLKDIYNNTCPCCGRKEPEIKLTADHIIPLTKGGSNYISNIQPLCKSCNSHKYVQSTKFPFSAV